MKLYMEYFQRMANGSLFLNSTETKIFGVLGLHAQYGGIVQITQKAIAKKLKIAQPQVSLGIKGLIKKNVITKKRNDMGIFYEFNSNFISKGSKKQQPTTPKIKTHLRVINGKNL